jgi:hypothetical protein
MNYAKPEITLLASASSVIQGTDPVQKTSGPEDSKQMLGKLTIAAYEADE